MIDYASHFRRRFIRELWRRLGRDAGDRPIALYGAGRHTAWLLETVADVERGPRIAFVLDDAPASDRLSGVPIVRPSERSPSDVAFVVVSSDARESELSVRAREWAGSGADSHRAEVIEPYRGLPAGPYSADASSDAPVFDDRLIPSDAEEAALDRAAALDQALPVPGDANRAGYAPDTDATYIRSGREDRDAIARVLADAGVRVEDASAILDWGCSTGRVLRHFGDLPQRPALWGCDIDEGAIEWGQRHLGEQLRLFSCTLEPHLPLPDASMDVVYGISIFTHISHGIDTWLMELRRITKPTGAVMVTVHDEHTWERCREKPDSFIARHCPRLDFSGDIPGDFVAHGSGPSSQTFWHSRGIRRRWSAFFDVAAIVPLTFSHGTQAGVVLKPRP